MKCAWKELLEILPQRIRGKLPKPECLLEIRFRLGQPVEIITVDKSILFEDKCSLEDLKFTVNTASKYSPWSAWTSAHGYVTASGGHRIGLGGVMTVQNGIVTGIREIRSACIRVAKEIPGIGRQADHINGSILIIGSPGCGKTTLLRDLIRRRSVSGHTVTVVDEKAEIFPSSNEYSFFDQGPRTDIISGCSKSWGLESAIRNMRPDYIAVDEITAAEDCDALLNAAWCGVKLIATAHARNQNDLLNRMIYKPLVERRIFDTLLVLDPDKSWHEERMRPWK